MGSCGAYSADCSSVKQAVAAEDIHKLVGIVSKEMKSARILIFFQNIPVAAYIRLVEHRVRILERLRTAYRTTPCQAL